MDKNLILETLKKRLREKIEDLEKGIDEAKDSAKQAPSFMESASDTSRQQYRYEAQSLEEQVKNLKQGLQTLEVTTQPRLFTLRNENVHSKRTRLGWEIRHYILLPAGGGEIIEGVTVVTPDSPLGQNLSNKKQHETVIVGNKEFKITQIS